MRCARLTLKARLDRVHRWLDDHNVITGCYVLIGGPLLLLGLPILLPIGAVLQALNVRRRRRLAARFPCLGCGEVLGRAALDQSDAAWKAHVADLWREHPGIRFRLAREVDAICTRCGATYRYDEDGRRYERVIAFGDRRPG